MLAEPIYSFLEYFRLDTVLWNPIHFPRNDRYLTYKSCKVLLGSMELAIAGQRGTCGNADLRTAGGGEGQTERY